MTMMLSLASTRTIFWTITSAVAAALLVHTIVKEYTPPEFHGYISSKMKWLSNHLSSQLCVVIQEFEGLAINKVFNTAEVYLGNKISPSIKRIKVAKSEKEKAFRISMDRNEELVDIFGGKNSSGSWCIREEKSLVNLLTLKPEYYYGDPRGVWNHIVFDHPSTFDTLAIDASLKEEIMADLKRKVGKAWKRGYLLYGPPGTGKSSLIAAMANFLNFDIYDLELANINSNSEFRTLLVATSNHSIIAIEDIDRTLDFQDRFKEDQPSRRHNSRVNLSWLLNFIDGLWSSCGDERIFVFTTNNKEKLDPALLRPGRMDKHIQLGYCNFFSFKKLVSNYHNEEDHPLFEEVKSLIEKVQVTPAEVAEQLLRSEDVKVALQGLIEVPQT
ncbi:hypothetical protein AMTR_s00014p00122360 [Amborella trichopoda]|uniref:AAA+ ATPase domain-containing protein n=1 Tax=Amborella trichopoda TaxID=13333 RepID=W1PMV0_AMBTC|nr:hypothetical protein AMTR_s00014p00122360 [Amborella trichopoda]